MSVLDANEIRHLRAELTAKEAQIARLQEALAHREARIAALEILPWDDLCIEIEKTQELLGAVLARDAELSPSGEPFDCGCTRLSRDAEREHETGTCPHQEAWAALAKYWK